MERLKDVWLLQEYAPGTLDEIAGVLGTVDSAALEVLWHEVSRQAAPRGRLWSSLPKAAARLDRRDLLLEMWAELQLRGNLNPLEAGAFATAAIRLGDVGLAREICEAALAASHLERIDADHSSGWCALAKAVSHTGDAVVLPRLWAAITDLAALDDFAWCLFAGAAADAYDGVLLSKILDAWLDGRPNYRSHKRAVGDGRLGRLGVWGALISAAWRLDDRSLFMRMFTAFESEWDPTLSQSRGSLQQFFWNATLMLPSADAALVSETLIGLRLNVDATLEVLRTESLGRRFDHAGHCLMKWLINSYFNLPVEEYRANLKRLTTGLLTLDRNRHEAWVALFSRGKEAFLASCAKRYFAPVESLAAQIVDVPDDQLVEVLLGSDVIKSITRVLGPQDSTVAPDVWTPLEDAPTARLKPLVEFYVRTHVEYLSAGQDRDRLKADLSRRDWYFDQIRRHIEDAGIGDMSVDDWQDVLHWTITATEAATWSGIVDGRLEASLHHSKRQLQFEFERLRRPGSPEVVLQRARDLRRLIRRMLLDVTGKDSGRSLPVRIAPSILATFGRRSRLPVTEVEIPEALTIAGWEGVLSNVLEPMFGEIRRNAERALASMPVERQYLRVTATLGQGDTDGYAIVTVSNAFISGAEDSYSTQRGIGIVHRLATMLTSERRVGFAVVDREDRLHGERAFTWHVHLPLPIGQSASSS